MWKVTLPSCSAWCSHAVALHTRTKSKALVKGVSTSWSPTVLCVCQRVVGDQHVETHFARLFRVVLSCGCIAYSDQVKGLGHMSFHMLITHGPFPKGRGCSKCGNGPRQVFPRCALMWLHSYSDQGKGLGHMRFQMLTTHSILEKGLWVIKFRKVNFAKLLCVLLTCGCIAY